MKYPIYPENYLHNYGPRPDEIYLFDAGNFEAIWHGSNKDNYLQPGSNNEFQPWYFGVKKYCFIFKTPRLSLRTRNGKLSIQFNTARHRTRWLIDSGVRRIPFALNTESVSLVSQHNIDASAVSYGELIELPVTDQFILDEYTKEGGWYNDVIIRR
jgi:hypothetical protein